MIMNIISHIHILTHTRMVVMTRLQFLPHLDWCRAPHLINLRPPRIILINNNIGIITQAMLLWMTVNVFTNKMMSNHNQKLIIKLLSSLLLISIDKFHCQPINVGGKIIFNYLQNIEIWYHIIQNCWMTLIWCCQRIQNFSIKSFERIRSIQMSKSLMRKLLTMLIMK